MLTREQIEKIIAFDYRARMKKKFDKRRYGSVSDTALLHRRQMSEGQMAGFNATFTKVSGGCALRAYWNAHDGTRQKKDGAPTRKTLRYNLIVPEKAPSSKLDGTGKRPGLKVYHVAVRLNRQFKPLIKDVVHFSPQTKRIEVRDMSYHQMGGWIASFSREEYDVRTNRSYFYCGAFGRWCTYKDCYRWGGMLLFPYHETVNPEDLKGTAYEWCQYEDGHGIGLCDWLALYHDEPKVELLAKLKLYSVISPMGVREMKKPKIFNYVKENLAQLQKGRYSLREIVWSANRGTTLDKGVRHYKLIESFKYFKPAGLRLDYERADKLIRKLKVDVDEYCRYLRYAKKAGLDLRNEGTVYPPVAGGRKAFMARLERIEAEAARREAERDIMEKYGVKSPEEVKKIMEARVEEIAAFQTLIDRSKTLKGAGYKLILAKTQEDLIAEGKRMGNCVGCGEYGRGIVAGDRLIVIISAKGKMKGESGKTVERRFDVEIDRKHWKVRQCYAPHNDAAPDEVRELAQRIADSLKAKAAEMRRKREARGKAAHVRTEKRKAA